MCGRRQRESGADSYGCYGNGRLWLDCPNLWATVDFIKKGGALVGSVHLHRRIPSQSSIPKFIATRSTHGPSNLRRSIPVCLGCRSRRSYQELQSWYEMHTYCRMNSILTAARREIPRGRIFVQRITCLFRLPTAAGRVQQSTWLPYS